MPSKNSNTDVVILCLNQIEVIERSLRRLRKEDHNVIVVDNGSDDDSHERLKTYDWITLVRNEENKGASVGRNSGLDKSTAEFVFLLDGDIQYVPGSVDGMEQLMRAMPDAGCIGVHNVERWNGTRTLEEADAKWPENPGLPTSVFPMAWTQFGLFRGDLLRKVRFIEEGAFGEAGNGYEDNYLYMDILKAGLKSYYLPDVLYYHEAHGGQKWLTEKGMDNKNTERRVIFDRAWNEYLESIA